MGNVSVFVNMHVVGMAGIGKKAESFFFRRSMG